jgi:hypothetical protein
LHINTLQPSTIPQQPQQQRSAESIVKMRSVLSSRMSRDNVTARFRRQRKLSYRSQTAPQRPPVLTKSPTQEYQRLFSPEIYGLKAINDPISGLRRLLTDPNSIVVAVKGTCRHNGHVNAIASYGVYFAEDACHLNENGIVPFPSPQTSQYAELFL